MRELPPLTIFESRLLAILEADGGWMDRQTIGRRYPNVKALSQLHVHALNRLVKRELVDLEIRPGPRGYLRFYYRYVPRR